MLSKQLYCGGNEYEEAVQSLISLGATLLRIGGSNLQDYFASSSPTSSTGPVSVNKLGVAADTWDSGLSQDEILHMIQEGIAVDTADIGLSQDEILHRMQAD